MYSSAASVTRGHHETSRERSFRKFSAISSMPSSVIFEQPDRERTVRLGRVCTESFDILSYGTATTTPGRPIYRVTYVDDTVVGDLPARLESEDVEGRRLLRTEVAEGRVGDVVGLQVELVEGGQKLRHRADALVRHVDAVVDGDGDEARVQRGPQALGCDSIDILGTSLIIFGV